MDKRLKLTARSRLANTLAEEILGRSSDRFFAIASEHQLCRRFNVSRVTVRLALSDLETKGLIFRKHGAGTFAYGRLDRVQRSIGMLLKTLPTAEQWPIAELIRGFHHGAAGLRTNVLLIHASPQEWSNEMIRHLGGVFLVPTGVTRTDLDFLEHIKMPFLLAWETALSGLHVNFGQKVAARIVAERMLLGGHERLALVTGFEKDLDALKKEGVLEALACVGLPSHKLLEFSLIGGTESMEEAIANLVHHNPQITAVIATDDSIAVQLIELFKKHTLFRVPKTVSIAGFHRSPFNCLARLSTVDFDFFEGGRRAAEALSRGSLSGTELEQIVLMGKIIAGDTVAPNRFTGRNSSLITRHETD